MAWGRMAFHYRHYFWHPSSDEPASARRVARRAASLAEVLAALANHHVNRLPSGTTFLAPLGLRENHAAAAARRPVRPPVDRRGWRLRRTPADLLLAHYLARRVHVRLSEAAVSYRAASFTGNCRPPSSIILPVALGPTHKGLRIAGWQGVQRYAGPFGGNLRLLSGGSSVLRVAPGPTRRILRIAVGQGVQRYACVLGGNLRLLGSDSRILRARLGPMRNGLRITGGRGVQRCAGVLSGNCGPRSSVNSIWHAAAAIGKMGFAGPASHLVHRQERLPKQLINVSGPPFLPHAKLHFDQGKRPRRIPQREVRRLFEVVWS
jgi:hypothetical protein